MVSFMATANTNVKLKNSMKYTYGMPAIGVLKTEAVVALLQYLTEPLQSSLKYCQVVAQVAHQVVTMITGVEAKAEIMA
jgi:hypothetical protein